MSSCRAERTRPTQKTSRASCSTQLTPSAAPARLGQPQRTDGPWPLAARRGISASIGAADVAVLLHQATSRDLVANFAVHHGLTPRESEILGLLVDGLASKQIARKLAISLPPSTATCARCTGSAR